MMEGRLRLFFRRHGKKLWWLHSVYALGLGSFVVVFAQKGFDHARWLAVSLGVAWLLLLLFFRLFGGRARPGESAPTKDRVRFFAMTYALKNLYQGMLFFLLPFYWKSTTFGAANAWFVVLLAACTLLSTIDLVFDRVLMRFSAVAAAFHAITLFGCLNLVIPALFPNTRTLWTLLWAGGGTALGFWTIHVPLILLRDKRYVALLLTSIASAVGLTYIARRAIPPVPMHLSSGSVGPSVLPDGRLSMEVTSLNQAVLREVIAVTDVVVPGGKGDRLVHVWRHEGHELHRAPEGASRVRGPFGTVRLRSMLTEANLPEEVVGRWSVDVETDDGQLVGRAAFNVTE